MSTSAYPVQVDATLQSGLSRWLWLVKWLLVIPHLVVLFFLWVAFAVLTVVALVVIVVTGRYPRGIFDFNVGVLRWSWRVGYYSYEALGTDRNPPFALHDVPGYPAHLEVAYPERLSRGLVLVKWWLLAIPHYLVLALFLGGGWTAASGTDGDWDAAYPSGGLVGLLVLIAAVVLLFTGRYLRSVFDLVLGMDRWALRVAAYVALMTDEYPPFRLDMGGAEPGGSRPMETPDPLDPAAPGQDPVPGETSAAGPAPGTGSPSPRREWGAGRVLAVVLAAVTFLVAGGLLAAGATVLIADRTLRDADGFLMSPSVTVVSPGSAVVSPTVQLDGGAPAAIPRRILGDARARVDGGAHRPVFVGVARSADAEAYLAGVAHSTLVDLSDDGRSPRYDQHPGGLPTTAPAEAGIWVASAAGAGRQTVTWPTARGDWTLVVMNVDGSRGVAATAAVGATVPVAAWVIAGLLCAGGLLLVVSVVVLLLAVRRPRGAQVAAPGPS